MRQTGLLFAALILLMLPLPAIAAQPQAMTVDTQLVRKVRPLPAPPSAPNAVASLLLVAGGNGVLNLDGNGDVQELEGNFLIRSAYRFLSFGLNVALLDAAPMFPGPNGFTSQRHTKPHAELIGKVAEIVQNTWAGVPVWLVGTSNGTISVANLGARLTPSGSVKGIVLTSSVTQVGNMPGESVMTLSPALGSIKLPTLVVWHNSDNCAGSPNASAHAVFTSLTGLAPGMKAEVVIKGGGWVAMPDCSALGYHGYAGVEDEVVTAIAKFIAAHP